VDRHGWPTPIWQSDDAVHGPCESCRHGPAMIKSSLVSVLGTVKGAY